MRGWKRSLYRFAASRDWALDLIGEERSEDILRSLLESVPSDVSLALSQIDRLPEWLDVLTEFLDGCEREEMALQAIATEPRLAGPYAELALRSDLERDVHRSLEMPSPADTLWRLSMRPARWLRLVPALAPISIVAFEPGFNLAAAAESLRDLARWVESGSASEAEIAAAIAAWPAKPEDRTVAVAERQIVSPPPGKRLYRTFVATRRYG